MSGIITDPNRFAYLAFFGALAMIVAGAFAGVFPIDQERFGLVSTAMTVALALPVAWAVLRSLGVRRGTVLLLALSAYAFVIELVGTAAGVPYGGFVYHGTTARVLGLVPWTTPFGWVPLVIGALVLVEPYARGVWVRTILGVLVLIGFDLVLDPGAVALGIWSYVHPGRYYGVPWTNFFGWIVTGGIALALLRNVRIAGNSALMSACLMMAFWTGVAVSGAQMLPAVFGVLAVLATAWGMRATGDASAHEKTSQKGR